MRGEGPEVGPHVGSAGWDRRGSVGWEFLSGHVSRHGCQSRWARQTCHDAPRAPLPPPAPPRSQCPRPLHGPGGALRNAPRGLHELVVPPTRSRHPRPRRTHPSDPAPGHPSASGRRSGDAAPARPPPVLASRNPRGRPPRQRPGELPVRVETPPRLGPPSTPRRRRPRGPARHRRSGRGLWLRPLRRAAVGVRTRRRGGAPTGV